MWQADGGARYILSARFHEGGAVLYYRSEERAYHLQFTADRKKAGRVDKGQADYVLTFFALCGCSDVACVCVR